MRILITGGTGLIGQELCKLLCLAGDQVTVLSRHPETVAVKCGPGVVAMSSLEEWQPETVFDAVINLAGEPIADKAWSEGRKRVLWDSRVTLTASLVAKIVLARVKPKVLLSGSAIGFYGNRQDELLDESSAPGQGFGAELGIAWEQAARAAVACGVRVCLLRTGLVLSDRGGILAKMLPRLGIGVRFGSGVQWMSWIHIDDYVRIVHRLLEDDQEQGAFNLTAPSPVRNLAFTRALVELRHGWALLPAPAFALNLLLGERAELVLGGQCVLPKRIEAAGYSFSYPDLPGALRALLLR